MKTNGKALMIFVAPLVLATSGLCDPAGQDGLRATQEQLRMSNQATNLVAFAVAQNKPYKMSFSGVAVADVLRAISIATGANIVLASQTEAKVSMNITCVGADDALRAATAASGLSYAKAGTTYIVATTSELRGALVPYGSKMIYPVPSTSVKAVADKLQERFPLSTVISRSDSILFIGQPSEFKDAVSTMDDAIRVSEADRPVSKTVVLSTAKPVNVEKMLAQVFPSLKIASDEDTGDKPGGVLVLTGRQEDVLAANMMASKLDEGTSASGATDFQVYKLQYTSAPSAVEFLKKAAPDVEAFAGPESFSPPRGDFLPLSSALRTAAGSGNNNSGGVGGGNSGLGTGGGNQSGGTGSGNVQGTQLEKDARSTVVVIKGTKPAVALASRLLAALDVKPIQVAVEVKVIETSKTFSDSLGVEYNWSNMTFHEVPPGTVMPSNYKPPLTEPTRPAGVGQFSRVPWSFEGVINAMVNKGDARILASPNIRVIDNEDANIFIGDTIRTQVSQANGLGGQTVDIIEFPVGIILLIRPRVNADGNITMHVNPVISSVTAVDSNSIPQTSSREAETTVMVKDGETIVLGGLIKEDYSKMVRAVPLLSDIPIIGELFKSRSTTKNRTEVIVTITPKIVTEEGEKKGD